MKMIVCPESSNVFSFGYSEDSLYVIFDYGGCYRYICPIAIYYALLAAPSKGQTIWQDLRRQNYKFERISLAEILEKEAEEVLTKVREI